MRSLLIILFLAACGSNESTSSHEGHEVDSTGAETMTDEPAIAEVPFPAEEIQRATSPGRTYVIEMREGEAEPQREIWTFEESSDAGFLLVVRNTEGTELRRSEGPWTELESHAHFPAAHTTIERTQLESELGTQPCRLYIVRDPDNANLIRRFWFADALPGAPIRMVVEADGTTVMEMQIVEHRTGRPES